MSEWTDHDGVPLGSWEKATTQEWRQIIADAGGLEALTVVSSLTDPEGTYGPPQIYTAWGRRGDDVPLVDIRDFKARDGSVKERILRKFMPTVPTSPKERTDG